MIRSHAILGVFALCLVAATCGDRAQDLRSVEFCEIRGVLINTSGGSA